MCVVFGLGGIGLNVIQGARMVGANKIVGVDINPDREEWGRRFGMTDFIDAQGHESREDVIAEMRRAHRRRRRLLRSTRTGNTEVMRTALECCHRGWGDRSSSAWPRRARKSRRARSSWSPAATGRGTAFGGAKGRTDVPKIVDWYMNGKIAIDPMITHVLTLDEINKGFDLMHAGESIRSVVVY